MLKKETIKKIVRLAVNTHSNNARMEAFAVQAANIAAIDAAKVYNEKSADAGAFVAASSLISLCQFASEISLLGLKNQEAIKAYSSENHNDNANLSAPFKEALETFKTNSFSKDVHAIFNRAYQGEQSKNSKEALIAASSIWLHVYASSRAAFVYAAGKSRGLNSAAFKKFIKPRLNDDLSGSYYEPSFLMRVLSDDKTYYLANTMMVAGLLTLAIGIAGLALPLNAATLGVSATIATAVTATGAGISLMGGTASACGLFAQSYVRHANDDCQKAALALNFQYIDSLAHSA
jgi:hypothetical protein